MFRAMMNAPGFYVMDEPESALSFTACLHLVALMHQLGETGAHVVCATHSPILAATPNADIVELGEHGYRRTSWDRLELVEWMRGNLRHAADHFGLAINGEPVFGWRLRTIGAPASGPGGPRWLRVVTEFPEWAQGDTWTANTDANTITGITKPRVLDVLEWDEQSWRHQRPRPPAHDDAQLYRARNPSIHSAPHTDRAQAGTVSYTRGEANSPDKSLGTF